MCNPCQGPSQGSWSKLCSFFYVAPSEGRLPQIGRHGPGLKKLFFVGFYSICCWRRRLANSMRIKKWHCEKTECLRRGGWRPNLQPWLVAIKPELFCYFWHPWIYSRGGLREKEEAKREVQKKAARYGPAKLCFPPRERKRFSKITFFYVCMYACNVCMNVCMYL